MAAPIGWMKKKLALCKETIMQGKQSSQIEVISSVLNVPLGQIIKKKKKKKVKQLDGPLNNKNQLVLHFTSAN